MLETGINIIEWPSLQYCTMSAFGGDALQRKPMSHKSSFIMIDNQSHDSEKGFGIPFLQRRENSTTAEYLRWR